MGLFSERDCSYRGLIKMLFFLSIFVLSDVSQTFGQTFTVTDSLCPPTQTASNNFIIRASMSSSSSVKCKLELRPGTTSNNLYAIVKITNINCQERLRRPINVYSALNTLAIDCSSTQPLSKAFKLLSDVDRLDVEFPANSYDYNLQLSMVIMYYQPTTRCTTSEFPCAATSRTGCIPTDYFCDSKVDCYNGQDEPSFCQAPSRDTTDSSSTSSLPTNVLETIANWFNADPSVRISIAVVIAVSVLFVLPTIVFCCCGKKKRKAVARPGRSPSRSRSRPTNQNQNSRNSAANRSRSNGRGNTRPPQQNARSGTSQQGSNVTSSRYEPVRSEPSAPPPPLSSVPTLPTAPIVLLPAGQLAGQQLYAVPYAQPGVPPAFVGAPGPGNEQPQYVAAYMLPPGAVPPTGSHVPLLLQTSAQPQVALPVGTAPVQPAPVAAMPLSIGRETCAPPTYDEAIRTPPVLLPTPAVAPILTPVPVAPVTSCTITIPPVASPDTAAAAAVAGPSTSAALQPAGIVDLSPHSSEPTSWKADDSVDAEVHEDELVEVGPLELSRDVLADESAETRFDASNLLPTENLNEQDAQSQPEQSDSSNEQSVSAESTDEN